MRRFPYVRVSPIERAVEHPAHWRALRIVSSPVPCRPSPWATLEVWSSGRPTKSQSCGAGSLLLRQPLTDPRGKESMCTTSPSMPQSCSHCLLLLTRAQADLLLAWQASRRHVVITTITFPMPWTPSSPSQRDQGGDEPIGREVCSELAQAPQTVPVARPVHERATLGPGYGP